MHLKYEKKEGVTAAAAITDMKKTDVCFQRSGYMPCAARAEDGEKSLSYRLVYSDKAVKNVSIRISRDGEVEVRSPRGVSEEFIRQLVESKRKLILRALAERAGLDEARSYYTLDYGYSAPLLGADYPIIAAPDDLGNALASVTGENALASAKNADSSRKTAAASFKTADSDTSADMCGRHGKAASRTFGVKSDLPQTTLLPVSCRAGCFDGSAFILPAGLEPIEVERALAGIYAAAGRQYLTERTRIIAADMGMDCPPVSLSGAKKQWGSCTHNKRGDDRISYSWRLMLASPRAVDSVVVHELCHVGEMSHGERFWRHVKNYMPDYSESHEELRRLAAAMARRFHV